MTLQVRPSGQACGAEVRGVDLSADPTAEVIAEIRRAWLAHHVLSFPEQSMSDDDLERFTLRFGPFGHDPFFASIDGHRHIAAIRRNADEKSSLFAENWHSDWSFQEFPPDGTCLYGKVIPPVGGDTWFADQTAALAAMPSTLRSRIEGRLAIHSARGGYAPDGTYGADDGPDRSMNIVYSDEAYETRRHPLIRVHPETGEESLYSVLGYIIGIEGMVESEALALLREVYAWQTQEEFQYRHRWEPDMLVMWDNRCVLHRATGGYDGHDRLLHRTTIGHNPAAHRLAPTS